MATINDNDQGHTLNGTGGFDEIRANGGDDVILAKGGADRVYGGAGNDEIHGDGGDDFAMGGSGADSIDGGVGRDVVAYGDSGSAVSVDLASGIGIGGTAAGDRLAGIEDVIGSGYNDQLFGDDVANLAIAGAGNDQVEGRGGDDRLYGQGGTDTVVGGNGDDVLVGGANGDRHYGGAGFDTASFAGAAAGVLLDLASGQKTGDAAGDTYIGIERYQGSGYGDTFRAAAGGSDMDGADGNDLLFGSAAVDELGGGNGADLVEGGGGADHMSGGDGADSFVFQSLADSGIATADRDIIFDFSHAEGDRIDLGGIDARPASAADNAFTFIGSDGFSAAGQVRFTHVGGSTVIELNTEGGSGAEMKITLAGVIELHAADFHL
ncbi:MAG: calcium-binding protein [Geminicoccaceae bacterium]